jgi:hypothetical protein
VGIKVDQHETNPASMIYGMYEYTDEWGNKKHTSARIGGFKTEEQAVKAITKRGGNGYTLSDRNVLINIVRDGQIKKVIP